MEKKNNTIIQLKKRKKKKGKEIKTQRTQELSLGMFQPTFSVIK
jgi:hypothetical protein